LNCDFPAEYPGIFIRNKSPVFAKKGMAGFAAGCEP
jgi:hypothetical protein